MTGQHRRSQGELRKLIIASLSIKPLTTRELHERTAIPLSIVKVRISQLVKEGFLYKAGEVPSVYFKASQRMTSLWSVTKGAINE